MDHNTKMLGIMYNWMPGNVGASRSTSCVIGTVTFTGRSFIGNGSRNFITQKVYVEQVHTNISSKHAGDVSARQGRHHVTSCRIVVVTASYRCLWTKHSFWASPCLTIPELKLLSSPWFGAPKTYIPNTQYISSEECLFLCLCSIRFAQLDYVSARQGSQPGGQLRLLPEHADVLPLLRARGGVSGG